MNDNVVVFRSSCTCAESSNFPQQLIRVTSYIKVAYTAQLESMGSTFGIIPLGFVSLRKFLTH